MNRPVKYLSLVLSALTLLACGGGGGGGASDAAPATAQLGAAPSLPAVPAVSLASIVLAKYEGVWQQACDNHVRRTTTFAATGANDFTVTPQDNVFANADCSGAVVATGSFGKAQETVQYRTTLQDTSVKLSDGSVILANVDPATSTGSFAQFNFTGTGVVNAATLEDGRTLTTINYGSDTLVIVRNPTNGVTSEGGLLLRNGELLALVPGVDATAAFKVNQIFTR